MELRDIKTNTDIVKHLSGKSLECSTCKEKLDASKNIFYRQDKDKVKVWCSKDHSTVIEL